MKKLEDFHQLGYVPVDGDLLQRAFAERPAEFAEGWDRGGIDQLGVLKLVLSDNVLETAILPPVNRNLCIRQGKVSATEKSRYNPLKSDEWWRFFRVLLYQRVGSKGKKDTDGESAADNSYLGFSKHRFTALKSAHNFLENEIHTLQETLRCNLVQFVALGNYAAIDECIFEHTGHGMRVDGHAMNIPHKPHPYGLLVYGLVQRLRHSSLPLVIDIDPRLPSSRPSGPEAFRILVARNFTSDVHIYADSLFAALSQAAELRRSRTRVSIAFADNGPAELRELRALAIPDLATSMSRTYSTPIGVAQLTGGKDHTSCVFTTYWVPPRRTTHLPSREGDYKIALGLLRCDATDEQLATFLKRDPTEWAGRRLEMLNAHFEVNLAAPLPGPRGLYLTKENLKELGKDRLLLLHNKTPGCSGGSRMKVDELIEEILHNHPAAKTSPEVSAWRAAGRTVAAVKQELLGTPKRSSLVTSDYSQNYGLLDRIDRALYENFGTAYFSSWNNCMVFCILFQQVLNAHSLYEEYLIASKAAKEGKRHSHVKPSKKPPIVKFVNEIIKALG